MVSLTLSGQNFFIEKIKILFVSFPIWICASRSLLYKSSAAIITTIIHSHHTLLILHGPHLRFCQFIRFCVMIVRKTFLLYTLFCCTILFLFQEDLFLPKRSLYKMLNLSWNSPLLTIFSSVIFISMRLTPHRARRLALNESFKLLVLSYLYTLLT